ncbi:unnamed protein product [Xylocopa violacea]|uniref:Carboxylesterase type B domain-containing protein n=1 Tax=Xylocopa violacea TaxID=135666 RepID=A0ABP1N3H3_XYLVO
MSGTPLCPWAYHTPEELARNAHQLAAILGFVPKDTNDLLQRLRQVPATELVNATQRVALNILPFRPTVEKPDIDPSNQTFLTECPITKYHNGDFHRHAMMMGYTHDEMILFLGPPIGVANAIAWAKRYLENVKKHHESVTTKPADIIAQLINTLVKNSFQDLLKIAMDIIFSGPIDLTQRLLAKQNADHPIYYYRLSYQSLYAMHKISGNPLNGTAHFDDIGYIFNVKKLHAPTDPMNRFNRFRKRMVTLWANFAKYGDPTPKNFNRSTLDATWSESGHDGFQMDINATSAMQDRLTDEKRQNYERSLYRVLPLISSCVQKPTNYLDFF